jgi:hypothetical protein
MDCILLALIYILLIISWMDCILLECSLMATIAQYYYFICIVNNFYKLKHRKNIIKIFDTSSNLMAMLALMQYNKFNAIK